VILLELAAQGIRGVAPAGGRATLRPGYNVVQADGAVLRRVLEALVYPSPRDADALPRAAAGPANAPMRAGLTVVGNDRVTYRLLRDFATGAQLQRFDAEKRSFAPVSQDLAEIAAFLQRTVGVPPQPRLDALLSLAAADLPSRADGVAAAALAAPARATLTPEQARKRIVQLKGELEKARVAEKLQYQLDGLQAALFKADEALKGSAKLRDGLESAEAARADLGEIATVAERLGDWEAKLAAFERATARRAEAAQRVAAEREAMGEQAEVAAPAPFWKAPPFWAGAGGGLAVALAGAVGAAAIHPDARYLALLDVPAFGWAAWVALRWVGEVEARERTGRRRKVVDDWERKVEAQYERDAAEIREAAKALGLSRPAELREALGRVADADAVVAEWRRRIAEAEGSAETRSAVAERKRIEDALHAVEAKLAAEAGGFVRDVGSVEAEIRRLEAEAAAPAAPAPAPAPRAAPPAEPFRALLDRAALALGGSPAAAGRAVAQRASQALAALSFQRLLGIVVDDRANVQVQSGGRAVAAASLPTADKDLVWLALKLSFVEQGLAAGNAIAVLEDAFGGLTDGARRSAARLLKQIAKPGQLLHATSDPSFREAADHSA
jgi:hypothetical protein